jgi:hypothetical protein
MFEKSLKDLRKLRLKNERKSKLKRVRKKTGG